MSSQDLTVSKPCNFVPFTLLEQFAGACCYIQPTTVISQATVSSPQWVARKHNMPTKQVEVEEGLRYRPYVPSPYRYRPPTTVISQATVSSPQWVARKHNRPAKQVEVEEGLLYRPYVPSPYRYRPNFVPQGPEQDTNNDDEDNDYAETDNLWAKVCGLLPGLCLMNLLPGMKVRRSLPPPPGRTISPQTRSSHESVGQAEDEMLTKPLSPESEI